MKRQELLTRCRPNVFHVVPTDRAGSLTLKGFSRRFLLSQTPGFPEPLWRSDAASTTLEVCADVQALTNDHSGAFSIWNDSWVYTVLTCYKCEVNVWLEPLHFVIVNTCFMVDARTEHRSSKSMANTRKSISLHSEYFEDIFSYFLFPVCSSPTTSPNKLYYESKLNSPDLTFVKKMED